MSPINMKLLLKSLLIILSIIFIAGLHMAVSYIAPFPLDKINVIFGALILFILFNKSGVVIWISFLLHHLVELYAISPFGIVLFAGTISTLIIYWLSRNLFTNPRPIVAIGITALGLIIYRGMYVISLIILYTLSQGGYTIGLKPEVFVIYMWEMLFTILLVSLLYFLISYYKGKKPGIL